MKCPQPSFLGYFGDETELRYLGRKAYDRYLTKSYGENTYFKIRYEVPCLKCINCKIEHKADWGTLCTCEMKFHEQNSFITLTYAKMPPRGSLQKEHIQKFWKRLRKHLNPNRTPKSQRKLIKYFAAGEYGENSTLRPHYHAIIFGWTPELGEPHGKNKHGQILYRSPELEKIWTHGYVTVGEATFDSATYVASYLTKRIDGSIAKDHYERMDPDTGEIYEIDPERGYCSQKIGISWIEKNYKDVIHDGMIVIKKGEEYIQRPIPRKFKKWLQENHPESYLQLRNRNTALGNAKNDKMIDRGEGPLQQAILNHRVRELTHSKKEDIL